MRPLKKPTKQSSLGIVYLICLSCQSILNECSRCELDAIPMVERNEFEHKSINEGAAHGCGRIIILNVPYGFYLINYSKNLN